MTRLEVAAHAARLKRSEATVWRWARAGCDFDNTESIKAFLIEAERKRTNVQRYRERRNAPSANGTQGGMKQSSPAHREVIPRPRVEPAGNGELPPPGRRGAAAALERLETAEERAHARLEAALERGDPLQIQAAQDFWLKCSETLRRLDLAVEVARREQEVQIPLKIAQHAVTAVSEWMKISFMVFLSSEGSALMGIRDFGEWKAYAVNRFKGILDLTVKGSLKTNSAVPTWASERIKEAWNVQET